MANLNQLLSNAILQNSLEKVQDLIAQGINVNTDNNGIKPLDMAAAKGYLPIVQYLVETVPRIYPGTLGSKINTDTLEKITPLASAAMYGQLEVVQYLIQQGAIVNAVNNGNTTALNYAACFGHLQTVQYLIQVGADINIINNNGITSLHNAAKHGHLPVVEYLIDKGANRFNRDNKGKTTVEIAKRQEIKRVLLTRRLPFNPRNWQIITSQQQAQIRTLMIIRNQNNGVLASMPNEMMFELFGYLIQ